jgi:gliding motility-associated lipoprotein GldB
MNSIVKNYAKCTSFLMICLSTIGCGDHKKIDVSDIEIDLKIERFDQDLAAIKPGTAADRLPELQKKYGAFYQDYFEKILNAGSVNDPQHAVVTEEILAGKPFQDLQKETNTAFPDLKAQIPVLTDAFKHIRYYYPEQKIPKLITYISGFQVQTPIGKDYIGIGLDMFLGKNSPFYPALVESIPRYISRRFTPENITPRVVEVLAREEMFPESDEDQTLLAKMIYHGKIMYFMKQVQPSVADSILIGYSAKHLKWAQDFESDTWAFFLGEDLLYNSDYLKIQKYLSEAPFTPGLGANNDSAPKLGIYIGWQIVNSFMEKQSEITLQQLMLEQDEQKILRLAKYRPSNKE